MSSLGSSIKYFLFRGRRRLCGVSDFILVFGLPVIIPLIKRQSFDEYSLLPVGCCVMDCNKNIIIDRFGDVVMPCRDNMRFVLDVISGRERIDLDQEAGELFDWIKDNFGHIYEVDGWRMAEFRAPGKEGVWVSCDGRWVDAIFNRDAERVSGEIGVSVPEAVARISSERRALFKKLIN